MLDLTGTWPRWSIVAAVGAPLLLAAAVVWTYEVAGPAATIALLAGGGTLLLALLVVVAVRRLRLAADDLRVGERALETSRHAIFVVDALRPGQPNRYVNPAYSALTGYAATDAVGDGFDALGVFTDPASVARLDETGSGTARVSVRRRDGTTVAAKLELRAVPRSDGTRYLLGLLDPLEAGDAPADVPARSEPASAADLRAREAFLSALSHDLRSPLNACVMWLDVLALAPQPDKLTQAVDAIKRNLARQTRLVNDLSDAAKISSGGLEVHCRPLDLIALLKSHIDGWQLLAIGKQLDFAQRIEVAAAPIDADPERMSQALNHLIDNAIASTPAGGRVELRVRPAGDGCVVEIEDTGVGLSADDAANLGAPLWRSPATAKARPGLGLGLAVAHHVAVRHGGTLTATSGGPGTCFTLTLPLAVAGERKIETLSSGDRSPTL